MHLEMCESVVGVSTAVVQKTCIAKYRLYTRSIDMPGAHASWLPLKELLKFLQSHFSLSH